MLRHCRVTVEKGISWELPSCVIFLVNTRPIEIIYVDAPFLLNVYSYEAIFVWLIAVIIHSFRNDLSVVP